MGWAKWNWRKLWWISFTPSAVRKKEKSAAEVKWTRIFLVHLNLMCVILCNFLLRLTFQRKSGNFLPFFLKLFNSKKLNIDNFSDATRDENKSWLQKQKSFIFVPFSLLSEWMRILKTWHNARIKNSNRTFFNALVMSSSKLQTSTEGTNKTILFNTVMVPDCVFHNKFIPLFRLHFLKRFAPCTRVMFAWLSKSR